MNRHEKPISRLQLAQQVEDPGLHGDVERRHRLVGDQHARLHAQRARQPDALALPAGELVRVAVAQVPAQPDLLEQLGRRARRARRPEASPCSRSGSAAMAPTVMRGFSDEYGSWKTMCSSRRSGRSCLRDSVVMSVPLRRIDARGRVEQPHDAVGHRRLAAARLAHEPEHLAGRERQRHAVDAPGPRRSASRGPSTSSTGAVQRPFHTASPGWKQAAAVLRADGLERRHLLALRVARAGSAARTRTRRAAAPATARRPGSPAAARRCCGARSAAAPPAGQSCTGCCGCANSSSAGRLLDLAARVHHDHAVGDVGDHAEVVRDEQDRRCRAARGCRA